MKRTSLLLCLVAVLALVAGCDERPGAPYPCLYPTGTQVTVSASGESGVIQSAWFGVAKPSEFWPQKKASWFYYVEFPPAHGQRDIQVLWEWELKPPEGQEE